MNKSLKEIAEELGISKQRVYRYCIKNHINDVHQENGMKQYDDAAQALIKSHFTENEPHQNRISDAHQNHITDAVIDTLVKQSETLQNQLLEKDKQIEALQLELAKEREHARHQSEQLAVLADNAQQLQKGQLVQQITDGTEKRRWPWQRKPKV
jgi:hypothetical protein